MNPGLLIKPQLSPHQIELDQVKNVLEKYLNLTNIFERKMDLLQIINLLKIELYHLDSIRLFFIQGLRKEDSFFYILTNIPSYIIMQTESIYDHEIESFLSFIFLLDSFYIMNSDYFQKIRKKTNKQSIHEFVILESTFRKINSLLHNHKIYIVLYRLYIFLKLQMQLETVNHRIMENNSTDKEIIFEAEQMFQNLKRLRYASDLGNKKNISKKEFRILKESLLDFIIPMLG